MGVYKRTTKYLKQEAAFQVRNYRHPSIFSPSFKRFLTFGKWLFVLNMSLAILFVPLFISRGEEISEEPQPSLNKVIDSVKTNVQKQTPEIYSVAATCYCSGVLMANGLPPSEGYVANNFLPFGTQIFVKELGRMFVVGDRIGDLSELDIYMDSYKECIQFGRQQLTMKVLN